MGRQSRREHTRRVIEHIVPIGASMADLAYALTAAEREWEQLNPSRNHRPDDWARMDADDEHIIIRFEVDVPEVAR